MSTDLLTYFAGQLRRRGPELDADAPSRPPWVATIEWTADLEREIRDLGTNLGFAVSAALAERSDS